jgi:hypothetical protein
MTLAAIFPGQGAKIVGMGAGLFDRFFDWLRIADRVLGYLLRALCLDDPRRGHLPRAGYPIHTSGMTAWSKATPCFADWNSRQPLSMVMGPGLP